MTDYFTNNTNNWPTTNSSGNTIMSIANSMYNFEHLKENGGWAINIPKTIVKLQLLLKRLVVLQIFPTDFNGEKKVKIVFAFILQEMDIIKLHVL